MDLSIDYLGITLAHPLMPGASPLADDMDVVRRLEDAGAAAIVLRSVFEEQLVLEQLAAERLLDRREHGHIEALSEYYPEMGQFSLMPDEYLERLQQIKGTVGVPVIASDIEGSIGLLGDNYAGYYPVENEKALSTLLLKAESDHAYYKKLEQACIARQPLFTPESETRGWRELLESV